MPDTYKNSGNPKTDNLWRLIGNTPLIALRYRYGGGPVRQILVKCEQYNLTHSIKDRVALYVLQKAMEHGGLNPGDLIVEASSGNIGISMAAIGRALGHPVKIILPDSVSLEHRALIKSFGTIVQLMKQEEMSKIVTAMGLYDHVFLPGPLEDQYNVEAHERTTGREIGHYLLLERLQPNAFVAGVGTGGTLMGVGNYLRKMFPAIYIHPLEPVEDSRIPGLSAGMSGLESLDKVVRVHDGDAILMAQKLRLELKLDVGISSGANLLGAIKLQNEGSSDRVVVTVFPDGNKPYAATEPVKPDYMTPQVQLLDYKVLDKK
jgi:cysteine synthase A